MAKKVFIGIAVGAIVAIATWNANINLQKSDLSSILLVNAEAFASGESSSTNYYWCCHK